MVAVGGAGWDVAAGADGPASWPAGAAAATTTTAPSGAHARESVATLRRWVAELADTDPNVRDRAREQLLRVEPGDLDRLRQAVAASRPLGPGQVAALREVVTQVYLSGERDEDEAPGAAEDGRPAGGFLGVQMAQTGVDVTPAGAGGNGEEGQVVGVAVAARVPGFCGYRALEDGDVILRLTSDKTYELRGPADLSTVVSQQRPGDVVTLDVLRRGKVVRVTVTLDRKPSWVGQFRVGEADPTGPRLRRAAEYWDKTFGPVVEDRT